jgi:hypothetical protein
MPPKKIVLKPDIDIVEINQSDLDKSENGDSEQGETEKEDSQNENEELHDIQAKKKKPVKGSKLKENSKAIKQSKKKIVDSQAEIEEDSQAEIEPKSKKSISKARLNALAAGRKRAHEKREEKKKETVEALKLQLKKELEAEGYTKKEIKKIENEKVQLRSAVGESEKSQPQPPPSDPVNAFKGVNRQSRLRIIEDSTISQHNGFTTYGGFEIPHVGGRIKIIGRKLI